MPNLHSTPSRPSTHFSPKRVLTRALMTAALIGGAGTALSAGSAQANPCADGLCSWSEWTADTDPGELVTYGNFLTFDGSDKKWTYADNFIGTAFPDTTEIAAFKSQIGKFFVEVDFGIPGENDTWSNRFSYDYIAEIFTGSQTFRTVNIDSETLASGESLTKEFRKDSFEGDVVQTLASLSGDSEEKPVPGGLQTLYVSVAFDPGQGGMAEFQDSYTQTSVPGPLPILGAGVAFGFSRKLRRRIQGDRVKA